MDGVHGRVAVATRYRPGAACLDRDGSLLWEVDGLAHSPSAVIVTDNGEYAAVATHLGSRLEVLEAETGQHVQSVAVPFLGVGLSALDGHLFVASRDVAIVNCSTWMVERTVPLPEGATSCSAGSDAAWIGCSGGVARVDASGTMTFFDVGVGPQVAGAALASRHVWVADHRAGACRMLDDRGNEIHRVSVRGHPWHLSVAAEHVFVVSPAEDLVTVVSSSSGVVLEEVEISRPWDIAYDEAGETLWCASPLDGVVRWCTKQMPRQ